MNAPAAWAAGNTGSGVRVAVLDAGIDHDHPDLAGNINPALSASYLPCLSATFNCDGPVEDWPLKAATVDLGQPGHDEIHGAGKVTSGY